MTAALTPELAIAYVRELSADVRAVIVLDAQGRRLAGPEAIGAAAARLIVALDGAPSAAARVPDGLVVAARTATHALVVVAGPHSLEGPTQLDAGAAVIALGGGDVGPAGQGGVAAAPSDAVRSAAAAVVLALQRPE